MSDEQGRAARERIEEARNDAAAFVVQGTTSGAQRPDEVESRLADATAAAADPQTDPRELERLADQVERDRDALKSGE